MNRSVFIDISKAICIILVVVGHTLPVFSPDWYKKMVLGIYTFHMPLFMFASGYLYALTKKNETYWTFLLKKIRRLVIPYLICSFIVITIKLLFQEFAFVQHPKTLYSFLEILYKPVAGYFLWFVWALWWIFVIIPFFKTKPQRLFLLLLAIILYFFPIHTTRYFCLIETQEMMVFFVAGCLVFDYKDYFHVYKKIPLLVYFLLFIFSEWLYFSCLFGISWMKFILAFLGIVLIVSLSIELQQFTNKAFKTVFYLISSSSYFIYLFHTSFEGLAKAILIKLSLYNTDVINNFFAFCLMELFIISFGLIIPIIIYQYFIKKYSFTRFCFGIK